MATSPITSRSAAQLPQQNDAAAVQKKNAQTQQAAQLRQNEANKTVEKAKAATPPQQAVRTENANKPPEPTTNAIGQVIGTRIHEVG